MNVQLKKYKPHTAHSFISGHCPFNNQELLSRDTVPLIIKRIIKFSWSDSWCLLGLTATHSTLRSWPLQQFRFSATTTTNSEKYKKYLKIALLLASKYSTVLSIPSFFPLHILQLYKNDHLNFRQERLDPDPYSDFQIKIY